MQFFIAKVKKIKKFKYSKVTENKGVLFSPRIAVIETDILGKEFFIFSICHSHVRKPESQGR